MMLIRLALRLKRTPKELESSMTRSEFLELIAYEKIRPSGEELQEVRFRLMRAQISYGFEYLGYVFGKVMTGKGSKPKSPKLDQFRSIELQGESEEDKQIRMLAEIKACFGPKLIDKE